MMVFFINKFDGGVDWDLEFGPMGEDAIRYERIVQGKNLGIMNFEKEPLFSYEKMITNNLVLNFREILIFLAVNLATILTCMDLRSPHLGHI